ncbi:uncharacterized protein LOC123409062 isoform X2 [Hordeum vulgare subsp. vulgare]|uniref:Uncharacterized protein n=1 Tax=Hordeum vulgare subsp. vulgare TaxID=112509 RepID=A0A8I6WP31_HORVV|nr:uncharacterized protein LOC123409062 isoform X2 [Hordeum vulgare subsp. vulgare]KAI5016176.1 hypothetical protein ZWY2020_006027 [Hordeum vulgare]
MAQQQPPPDAPPLGFFERISTCDVSLRKRQLRDSAAMASSDPALPPPLLLLPPPAPEQALAPPPARANPRPTVLDGVLSLFRSGESLIRGAFRCNSRRGSPSGPPPSQQQQQQQPPPHHRNHPGEIMKRLQRETFPDVMRLMDKHEQIDRILSMYRSGKGFHFPELPVRVKVALDAVGALLLVDDEEFDHAREILGEAGNRTGLNSRFVLESKTRGNDTIAAELCTRLGIGATLGEEDTERRPLELTRLQYCAHVNHWLSMILVPFGAQCNGFLHGTSLIQNLRSQASLDGPPSFSEQHNCAAGLSMRGSNFTVSLAELVFGSGAQGGDHGVANRMTTFGQVRYEPAQDVKLSLSGLWQIRPLLSRFNNLGTLAIPFGSLKPQRSTPPSLLAPTARNDPAALSTAAAMVECELFEAMRAQGWVEMEGWSGRGAVRWGCCLSDTPEHELGWGVRMGGTAEGDMHRPHLEGFLSFNLGRGGKLQPSLVYVMEGEKRTPALVLRSSWFM